MKKRIVIYILLSFLLVILGGCTTENKSKVVGWYLKSGESHLIIDENGGPIVMGNASKKEDIFEGFENGDKIEITCGPIRESYPGGTEVYSCKRIQAGDIDNIPKDTLDNLKQMGWEF